MADNSEINDNIIAYNKVEIPELKITIPHDFIKNDTDKLYLTPHTVNNEVSPLPEDTETTPDENVFEQEIESDESDEEKPAAEDEAYEKLSGEYPGDYNTPLETADMTGSPVGETSSAEKPAERENQTDVITEDEELPEDNIYAEEQLAENIPDEPEPADEDREDKIPGQEDVRQEISGEGFLMVEKISQTAEPDVPSGAEDLDEDSVNDVEIDTAKADELSENPADSAAASSQDSADTDQEWNDLKSNESEEEVPDVDSEEEKFRFDAEEEKLKYEDAEMDLERILDAVKKINSSFEKHTVFSNIIRESVKLTEAQAGQLYRADSAKNLLVAEQETEDGYMDTGYSISGGLTGLAAETGEIINVREPLKDFRFSEDIDSILGIAGSSILCVPVKNDDGETIAVITLANSSSGKFSISDEERISRFVPHVSRTLQFLSGFDKLLDENKNAYLSTLTRFITDNIKTPVLTMKYYAGQIKKKSVPSEVRTVLNVLMDQADSVVDFLHSTLAFTEKRNPLNIEKCSLSEVIDDSLGLLAEYVESRNVGLYKKVEGNINVRLDKKAFYQACHQIAKNACDAMGENGNIYITAKLSGDVVNIEFRDTGPGIRDEIKEQIFQPFKSFNNEHGTGLGLAIAQSIVREHGGELTVESKPEQGATFTISLPVFDEI